ncbi:MAG: hypothetical protein EHM55_13450 [Acidobacteria bacterium]|nr:MAG: hypothetical protein EHM55_13450 [Acidobacteriota bacterium]
MRKSLLAAVCLAVTLEGVSMSAAQSLADVARAEAARRKALGNTPSKTYTNDDLRGGNAAPTTPDTPTAAPAAPSPAPAATPETTAPQPPQPPERPQDEKYWRNRITVAREALQRSQAFFDALQSHINGLYTEFVAMGDPYQRAVIEKKRFEAIAEQDRVKADIAQQTKAIAAIEDEARRASVPAGWLR